MKALPTDPLLRVGRSKSGLGLFACEPIKKGRFIAEYWGKVLPSAKADELDNRYLFEVNSKWTIDGSDRRNMARYINHGCKPNAESDIKKGQVFIKSRRNIAEGDEITYDYGKNYFETFIEPHGCRCIACKIKAKVKRAEARTLKAKDATKTTKAKSKAKSKTETKAKTKTKATAHAGTSKTKTQSKTKAKTKGPLKSRAASKTQSKTRTSSKRKSPQRR